MSSPVLEQIADAIVTRLEGVTEDDGYDVTLSGVVRRTRNGTNIVPQDLLCVVEQLDLPEPPTYLMGNPPRVEYRQPFGIIVFAVQSDKDTTPVESYCNSILANVHKAICTPLATWHNWDDLAINTELGTFGMIEPGNGIDGVALQFTVTYRTPENDPFTVAS